MECKMNEDIKTYEDYLRKLDYEDLSDIISSIDKIEYPEKYELALKYLNLSGPEKPSSKIENNLIKIIKKYPYLVASFVIFVPIVWFLAFLFVGNKAFVILIPFGISSIVIVLLAGIRITDKDKKRTYLSSLSSWGGLPILILGILILLFGIIEIFKGK
jgi:hypothetical protein